MTLLNLILVTLLHYLQTWSNVETHASDRDGTFNGTSSHWHSAPSLVDHDWHVETGAR